MSSRADLLYRVYVGVLLLAVLTGPALYAAVVSMSSPPVVELITHPHAPSLVVAAVGVLLVAGLAAGAVRGPVMMSPFRMHVVAGGPQPRRVALRGAFWSRFVWLPLVGAVVGALAPAALVLAGVAGAGDLVAGVLIGVTVGILVGVAWLAGQALSSRTTTRVAVLCLLAAAVLALAWPSLAGAVGMGAPVGVAAPVGLGQLLGPALSAGAAGAAVCLLIAVVPPLLDHLRGPVLLEQAHRWQRASTAGGAGDLAGAAATFRLPPRRPRPAGAVGTARLLPLLFLHRDLVGALRTPARSLSAVAGLGVAVVLGVLSASLPDGLAGVVLGASSLLAYLALGVWSDGFRHAVEASAAPTLYGIPGHQLMGLHALLPLSVIAVVGTTAAIVAVLLGGQPLMAALVLGGAVFCLAVRMYDAAKGPMPLVLFTPVPTPLGDASGIPIGLWQADALLIATLVPLAVAAATVALGTGLALLLYVPVTAAVLLALRHRLRTT